MSPKMECVYYRENNKNFSVIGIGASAGGLEAL